MLNINGWGAITAVMPKALSLWAIPDSSIIFLWHQYVDLHFRSLNPKLRLFQFYVSELCTIMYIANAPVTSMLKILSDPIINRTIGSSAKINN